MRNYSVVSPAFWTGKTGKKIKSAGAGAQVIALYLMTSPHSNMIGLYFLPKPYISYETGMTPEGVMEALQELAKAGFCDYDDETEVVWVFEMARFQVGSVLTTTDNRVKAVRKELENTPKCKFQNAFRLKYAEAFHLDKGVQEPLLTEQSSSGPDQEQDQEQKSCTEPPAPVPFVSLILNDKSEHPIFEDQIAEWQGLYPAADVRQELRNMRGWCIANPRKCKTKSGILRFVTSWLSAAQNKGGSNAKDKRTGEHLTPLQRVEKAYAERQ